jgi:hypothetical protein
LIDILLSTDVAGNAHALARRMGIQEIIWNCRSWWSGAERMEPYSPDIACTTIANRQPITCSLSCQASRGQRF